MSNLWQSILADCAALSTAETEQGAIPLDGNDPAMEAYNLQLRALAVQLSAAEAQRKLLIWSVSDPDIGGAFIESDGKAKERGNAPCQVRKELYSLPPVKIFSL